MKIKIIASLLIIFTVINITSCKALNKEASAEKMLEKKYNQSFVVDSVIEKNYLEGYYTVVAYPTDKQNIKFRAHIDTDENGMSDSYASKCIFRKISDTISKNIDSLDGKFYVYCTPLIESTTLSNPDMSIDEYIEEFPNEDINVYLHYAPENMDVVNFYNSIQNMFNGIGSLNGMIYISIVDEKGIEDIQDYFDKNDQIYESYNEMVEPYYKGYIPITSGKIDYSLSEVTEMLEGN